MRTRPITLPNPPFASRQARHQLAKALTDTLAQDSNLRKLWLVLVYRINPQVPLPYQYIDSWFWVFLQGTPAETMMPAFEQFERWLCRQVPDWSSVVTVVGGQSWLLETAKQCAN